MGKQYPSVDMAREQGDFATLKHIGRLGGINNARARAARKATDERVRALQRGTLPLFKEEKKKRPTITWKRLIAMMAWVKNPANYADECWLRDEQANLHICPLD